MTVRVRFAPSPTGHLHIGSARTALFNYLFAKSQKGSFILRIEDTDIDRNVKGAEEKLLKELQWLNLMWDEGPDIGGDYGPYRSMERTHIYQEYLKKLLEEKKAYRCFCTKEALDHSREELMAKGEVPRYANTCRYLSKEEEQSKLDAGLNYTVRFKVPAEESIHFNDLVRKDVTFQTDDVEDFVIYKSNGIPTYHFAVCVDDMLMKITHVIRGEEHLSNTPKHILLFNAFGAPLPKFAHIPLILNESGKKLSKRDESVLQFIEQYRNKGYLPQAIDNALALLGWSPGGEYSEEEIFTMEQLVELFTLDRINRSGAIFDPSKLAWINGQYIKKMDVPALVELAIPYFHATPTVSEERIYDYVSLLQSGMNAVEDIVPLSSLFLRDEFKIAEEGKVVLEGEGVGEVLSSFSAKIVALSEYTPSEIKACIKETQKETGYRGKQLFMPIRVAVTGETQGPDLDKTIYLLGKGRVVERIQSVLSGLQS